MPRIIRSILPVIAALGAIAAAPAPFSDPIGVYAVVDRVVLEPNATNPTAIQVWGVFATASGQPGDDMLAPVRGYMYFALNNSNLKATLAEWNDLKSVAGKATVIGFATRYKPTGRIRRASEAPTHPDEYPLGYGMAKMTNMNRYGSSIEQDLLSMPGTRSPADGGKSAAGRVTLVAGNIGDANVDYLFEIEGPGAEREVSSIVKPGATGETSWSPKLVLRAGQTYTWRVRTSRHTWRSEPATATFTVGQ